MTKRIKGLVVSCLCLTLLLTNNSMHKVEAATSTNACDVVECATDVPDIIDEYVNANGNTVVVYSDGVEVETIDEDYFIVRDFNHVFSDEIPTHSQRSWIEIGIAIVKFVVGVVNACSTIQYVTGHDICKIVLSRIVSQYNGEFRYVLSGNYISGYIPGCEPAYSLPCNSGYWEYSVRRS
ncbi:MAG: hypothetical protein Q4C49_10415 [Bacillota bacterium]|nr:hypothetical protein [Bacillota bacterium]